jgi:hypothetical protein
MNSAAVRLFRNVSILSFLLLRSSLRSCVAALGSLLLSGVRNLCHSLRIRLSSMIFCLIFIGKLHALGVSELSGLAIQPAHFILSLKNLTAASMSPSVLREIFKVNFSLTRHLKSSQVVCLMLTLGCFYLFCSSAVSVIKTGE